MLYFIFSIRLPRKKIILTPSILLLTCNNSTRQRFFKNGQRDFGWSLYRFSRIMAI